MFRRQQPGQAAGPEQQDWNELYFHQKLLHLVDYGANLIFQKQQYWLPCVGAAIGVALFLFSGENAIGDVASVAFPVASPVPQPPSFGARMPRHPGMEEPSFDEDDESPFDEDDE